LFATQDKGSGINRYEVREGLFGRFVATESPYVLRNQKQTRMLVVRAIDNNENVRNVVVHPQGILFGEYGIIIIVGILIVLIVFGVRILKRRF
jgi:hypothetical protein